ncbi:MAG: hypothetical protein ACI9FO_000134 [Methylophagaceae bacterium]
MIAKTSLYEKVSNFCLKVGVVFFALRDRVGFFFVAIISSVTVL